MIFACQTVRPMRSRHDLNASTSSSKSRTYCVRNYLVCALRRSHAGKLIETLRGKSRCALLQDTGHAFPRTNGVVCMVAAKRTTSHDDNNFMHSPAHTNFKSESKSDTRPDKTPGAQTSSALYIGNTQNLHACRTH